MHKTAFYVIVLIFLGTLSKAKLISVPDPIVVLQPTTSANSNSGWSIVIENEWLAVGSYQTYGAVFMYINDAVTGEWDYHSTLTPTDAVTSDGWLYFGEHLAMDGTRLAVTANGEKVGRHSNVGAVFTFTYDSSSDEWREEQRVVPHRASGLMYACNGVALYGDLLVASGGEGDTFLVSTFSGGEWEEMDTVKIKHMELMQPSWALSYPWLVMGALYDDDDAGTVVVFDLTLSTDSWSKQHTVIKSPNPQESARFGSSVSIDSRGTLAVGEMGADAKVGAAHLFAYNATSQTWSLSQTFPGRYLYSEMGSAVSLSASGDYLAITHNASSIVTLLDCYHDTGSLAPVVCEPAVDYRPLYGEYAMEEGLRVCGFGTSLFVDEERGTLMIGSPYCSLQTGSQFGENGGASQVGAVYEELLD